MLATISWIGVSLFIVGVVFAVLAAPFIILFGIRRDVIDTQQKAQYWREKWHYDFSGKNETLLRASGDPSKPADTLLRASGETKQESPETLLRAAIGESRGS